MTGVIPGALGQVGKSETRPARLFIVLIVQVVLMAIQKQAVANLKIVKRHFARWLSQIGSNVGLEWNTNAELVNY